MEGKGSTPTPASTKQQSEERASSATHALPEPAGGRATAGRTRDPGPSARPSVSAAGKRRVDSQAGVLSGSTLALDGVGRCMGWGRPGGVGGSGSRLGLSHHRASLPLQPMPTPPPHTSLPATPPTANPRERSSRKSSEAHRERTFRTIEAHRFPAARAESDSVSAILDKGKEAHRERIGT